MDIESLELSEAQSFGGLAVLRKAWDDLGLGNVLAAMATPRHSQETGVAGTLYAAAD